MNKIAFYGSIYSGDYKIVASILKKWLLTDNLDIKIRLSGEEIVYDNEKIYLYCYNAVIDEGEEPSFLLEGNISQTLDQVKALLHQLLQLYREQDINSNFECVEINENGDELSEQCYLSRYYMKIYRENIKL
ncbi:hypothetical protein [Flavobacterium sp.]|jgi:hypothetical protein|uniref:hypothetical protein n=1 Tax=Flavobacterium sp. TaxID=239 RepID=UPI0037BE98D8